MTWRLKLAVFLMLISVLGWLPAVTVPFLGLNAALTAWLIGGGIVFGQVAWNVGLLIGGVEAVAKRHEIVQFFKNVFAKNTPQSKT